MALGAFFGRLFGARPARVPRPEAGTVVYAVGDIHGCAGELDRLHQLIAADAARLGEALRPVRVYLGDYVDRGPDSKGVIDRLIAEAAAGETVTLMGNHDAELLTFLGDPTTLARWRAIGATETLASYGMPPPPVNPSAADLAAYGAQFRALMPEAHAAFFRGLKPCWRSGDLFFAHAGVRPGLGIGEQSAHDLMWIREPFLSSSRDFGAYVVHGHSSGYRIDIRDNRLCIDTGAYATGALSAAVFDGGPVRILSTRPSDVR